MLPVRRPSPFLAALLSLLIPGAGQWYAGHRRRAKIYLAVTVALVMPAIFLYLMVFYVSGIGLAITMSRPFFDNPDLLVLLLAANAALLVFRAVSVVDAYLLARGRGFARGGVPAGAVIVGLAFLLFLTAVPHAWVGHRNILLYDLLTHDFNAPPGASATTTSTASGSSTSTTLGPSTTTSTTLSDAFPEQGRVNVLLLGGDSGIGRESIRTDTMVVLSIDPTTGWTAMFSIPRNLREVPLPPDHPSSNWWGDTCPGCYPQLLNLLYADGLNRPDLFGEPAGANSMKVVIGHLLGIDIHYYALVDMVGFITIVDAIGGIEIEVPEAVYNPAYMFAPGEPDGVLDIKVGLQHMDGRTALGYARSRAQGNDFDRMSRQRCVLQAIAEQTDPVTTLRQFPTLVPVIEENVFTDIPVSAVPDFIELLEKFNADEVVSVRYMPDAPEFAGTATSYMSGWTEEGYPIPNRDFIAERTATALSLPPLEAITALGLEPLEDVCKITP